MTTQIKMLRKRVERYLQGQLFSAFSIRSFYLTFGPITLPPTCNSTDGMGRQLRNVMYIYTL